MVKGSSPSSMRFRLATKSLGLKLGILVIQPVPIPSAPLTRIMGMIGQYLQIAILSIDGNNSNIKHKHAPFRFDALVVVGKIVQEGIVMRMEDDAGQLVHHCENVTRAGGVFTSLN